MASAMREIRMMKDGGPIQDAPFRPSGSDGKGGTFSHVMESANWDNKNVAYPTIFPTYKGTPSRTPTSDDVAFWTKDNSKDAYLRSANNGELRTFNKESDAQGYAEGAWKGAPQFQAKGGAVSPQDPPQPQPQPQPQVGPDVSRFDELLFNSGTTNETTAKFQRKQYAKAKDTHLNSNQSCLAGALNCNTDNIAPILNTSPTRALINTQDAKLADYSIESKSILQNDRGKWYSKNNSIDSWEVHQMMGDTGIGTRILNADDPNAIPNDYSNYYSTPDAMPYLPNHVVPKEIPIGAILGMGESKEVYTQEKDGSRNRHSVTVVGYDTDGMPMIYDYGELVRLDNPNVREQPITNITVPNGYEKYTFDYISNEKKNREINLGITDGKPIEYGSTEPHFQAIERGANEIKNTISYNLGVKESVVRQLAGYLPGIAMQESGVNNNVTSTTNYIKDNWAMNEGLKPAVKNVRNAWNKTSDWMFGEDTEFQRQDYELEIEAYKEFPEAYAEYQIQKSGPEAYRNRNLKGNTFVKKYKELKEANNELAKAASYNTTSSKGPFSIKDMSPYMKSRLSMKEDDLYGTSRSNSEELYTGSKAALTLLTENYVLLRNKYRKEGIELTEDQLTNLALASYNNTTKSTDPEYIKYFVKGPLTDDYVDKVKTKGVAILE